MAKSNLEQSLQSIKRIGAFSEAEKNAMQKAFRKAAFPGDWAASFSPSDNDIIRYDAASDKWGPEVLPGSNYLTLSDTPSSFSGDGGRFLRVNSGESAVEHSTAALSVLSNVASGTDAPTAQDVLYWTGSAWDARPETITAVNGQTGNVVVDIEDVSPTTTKGDIMVHIVTGTVERFVVGTDGQVLTANSAFAGGLEWAASPSGFADPMTTRGDIIYKDASNVTNRLAVGSANYVLTSDGTDVAWAVSVAGTTVFTGLTDTPSTYSGQANKYVVVNSGASALEFTSVSPVTQVTGTSPIASSGGTTPVMSIQAASAAQHGYMSLTYANKLDNIENNADVTDAANVAAAGAFIGNITVSASAPSGGSDGDIWFEIP